MYTCVPRRTLGLADETHKTLAVYGQRGQRIQGDYRKRRGGIAAVHSRE